MGKHVVDLNISEVDYDTPLQPDSALDHDRLSRGSFAGIAASALRRVSATAGFVLSIEGAWGSGKSSTLAMIQALLARDSSSQQPIVVHFNPWLIGEKDALLRQFLSSISTAIRLSDHSRDGKKVAKELKAYSKVFDLVKLIPGAEPWASMIKSVVEAAGDATGAVSEYKTPDIEVRKQQVEQALRKFGRPVIVFIDDIDRLFPAEVFEMIRIIKAVGGLPGVGYVVAWDAPYVSSALQNLQVPQAASYLDKIVQVRMPLPNLSLSARGKLFDCAMERIDPLALKPYFTGQDKRLGFLYHSGLRDLLEQPRDVVRVFNALRLIEPLLRGEIVFADILGLAALSVKAPQVFELMKRNPRLFVGRLDSDAFASKESDNPVAGGIEERRRAYDASAGYSVRQVVHFLFPEVASAEDGHSLGHGGYAEGIIAHPSRLIIALQLSLTDGDVSISAARQYLQSPQLRVQIVANLTLDNCEEFVDMLGEVGRALKEEQVADVGDTCLSIARLPDVPIFVERTNAREYGFRMGIADMTLETIKKIAGSSGVQAKESLYERIATAPHALTCAAEVLRLNFLVRHDYDADDTKLDKDRKAHIIQAFSKNVLSAAKSHQLLGMNRVGPILRTLGRLAPEACPRLFSILKESNEALDGFVVNFLGDSWDSSKGRAFGIPRDQPLANAYCTLGELKKHAEKRLKDRSMTFPIRAAWMSVIQEKTLYGVDGSDASR